MSQSKFLPITRQIAHFVPKAFWSLLLAVTIATVSQPDRAAASPRPAAIVVDAKSGKVMYSEDPDGLRYPASLTKMMTLYMVFEALESGRISLQSRVPVSKFASAQAPSKLGVKAGSTFSVEQGILALVTRSANDCSTALAEFLGGSEPRFGKIMTAKARALGMTRTVYHNANGLPDPRQVTTARDQARLGLALRKHYPQYYSYFSTRNFKYGKQTIGNHNRLLGVVRGVDGIKTGFTRAAGFNLVTSANVDGRSIVGVVMGSPTGASRNAKMRRLVEMYLPRSGRKGGSTDMIASKKTISPAIQMAMVEPAQPSEPSALDIQNVTLASRSISLPDNVPVPLPRYEQSTFDEGNQTIESVVNNDNVGSGAIAQGVQGIENESQPAVSNIVAKVDAVTTASTTNGMSGWVIQVGAAPVESEAMALLQKAKTNGGKVLRSATPFTVAYVKGNEQLFRARFGGFSNQENAVTACNILKKKGVGCWAALQ